MIAPDRFEPERDVFAHIRSLYASDRVRIRERLLLVADFLASNLGQIRTGAGRARSRPFAVRVRQGSNLPVAILI